MFLVDQLNHTFVFCVISFQDFLEWKMGKVDEGSVSGSSGETSTSSFMVIDKSLSSAEANNPMLPIGYPAHHVTDPSKRHMCSRCPGVLRQPLQVVCL
jgi:hypothetical protein